MDKNPGSSELISPRSNEREPAPIQTNQMAEFPIDTIEAARRVVETITPVLQLLADNHEHIAQRLQPALRQLAESQRRYARWVAMIVEPLTKAFNEFNSTWAPLLLQATKAIQMAALPPNVATIQGVKIGAVLELAESDGIALFGAPRERIVKRLLSANTPQKRRRILGDEYLEIALDCRTAINECSLPQLATPRKYLALAIDAIESNHLAAAQALLTTTLDTTMSAILPSTYQRIVRSGKDSQAAEEFSIRTYLVLAPLMASHVSYRPEDGSGVPRTYSRHASVHAVGDKQYSKRNMVQALLLATSLACFAELEDLPTE